MVPSGCSLRIWRNHSVLSWLLWRAASVIQINLSLHPCTDYYNMKDPIAVAVYAVLLGILWSEALLRKTIDPFQKSETPCGSPKSSNIAALMAVIGDHARLNQAPSISLVEGVVKGPTPFPLSALCSRRRSHLLVWRSSVVPPLERRVWLCPGWVD
uniref:Putative secreted protein n=1 Tax=Ixodes ricinus TaxID=34613 RepID=A0A6B0UXQ6_IXORI